MKIVERKIADLREAEYNPRRMTAKQRADLRESLREFGCVDPVIVNKHPDRMDVIVGGHQRASVWKELGHDTIPTVEVSLDLERERELNVRLNKNTGEWDWDAMANHFSATELERYGFEPWEFGFSRDEEFFQEATNQSEPRAADAAETTAAPPAAAHEEDEPRARAIRKIALTVPKADYQGYIDLLAKTMERTRTATHSEALLCLLAEQEAAA